LPNDTYTRLITLLDEQHATYRLIDHAPEGRTEIVSAMRGNALAQAAKCLILMVKLGKKTTRYVLAVIPGDARLDLGAVKALLGGTYAAFASAEIAERLAGSVAGTILPFALTRPPERSGVGSPELELIVDPALLENDELYFNAARLDRSLAIKSADYARLARPRLARIVAGTAPEAKGLKDL
jgi:Ala-tRNA(Pro) deacylase